MKAPRFTDAQIFFVSLLGFCLARLCREVLLWLPRVVGGDSEPSLIARVAPQTSTLPIYLFFVLLPVALAVLAIGIPFFLRTVRAALRRELSRSDARGLLLIALAVALAAVLWNTAAGPYVGMGSVGAVALIAFVHCRHGLGHAGGSLGTRLLGTAGGALLVVAYYEGELLAGADASVALAPTFVVLAVAFSVAALPLCTAAALARTAAPGWPTALAAWTASLAWFGAPRLADAIERLRPAEVLEIRMSIAAGSLFVVLCLVAELRRRRGAVAPAARGTPARY